MTSVTQKFIGVISAPWTGFQPQVQFATLTFDDASPISYDDVRAEFGRRSAFRDADAVTTGDTWPATDAGDRMEAIEQSKVNVIYMAEFNPFQDLLTVSPPNLPLDYEWPAVPLPTVLTIDGDDVLTTNCATTDGTPPLLAEGLAEGDVIDVIINGAVNASFTVDEDGEVASGSLEAITDGVYTAWVRVRRGNQTSRTRSFTITKTT